MKEIWKLIELANQYEIEKEKSEWVNVDKYVLFERAYTNYNWLTRYDKEDQWEWDNLYWDTAVAYLISKSFGMVKWLVDNDKIDLDKVPNIFTTRARDRDDVIYAIRDKHDYNVLNEQYWVDLVDNVIMLVSIQDEPIEFLVSILK